MSDHDHKPEHERLLARYEAGGLEGDELDLFEAHLLSCDCCWRELDEMTPLWAALRGPAGRELLGPSNRRGRVIAFPIVLGAAHQTRPRRAAMGGRPAAHVHTATFQTESGTEGVRFMRRPSDGTVVAHVGVKETKAPCLLRLKEPNAELAVGPDGRVVLPGHLAIDPRRTRVALVLPSHTLELHEVPGSRLGPWVLRPAEGGGVRLELSRAGARWVVLLELGSEPADGLSVTIESADGDHQVVRIEHGRGDLEHLEPGPGLRAGVFPA